MISHTISFLVLNTLLKINGSSSDNHKTRRSAIIYFSEWVIINSICRENRKSTATWNLSSLIASFSLLPLVIIVAADLLPTQETTASERSNGNMKR